MTIEEEIEAMKKKTNGLYVAEWSRKQSAPHVHLFSEKLKKMEENPYNELEWPMFCIGSWEECMEALNNLPDDKKV